MFADTLPGNPFFQLAAPVKMRFKDVPIGRMFTYDNQECVRVYGGYRLLVGRPPIAPKVMPPLTWVEL